MINEIKLGSRIVSSNTLPYIIAEIGVNHEGSIDQARRLIDLAKQGGADAAKFQTYKADTLASKHSPSYWDTSKEPILSQHKLFSKYDQFGPDEYILLAEHCSDVGIDFLSTPFDDKAINFLDPLMPFYKVASADITNLPFLRKIANKNKPVVLSTGASTLGEIDTAITALTDESCENIALLHCILNYPTETFNANLRMITGLKRAFPDHIIGYSDHTLPDESLSSLLAAYLLGAPILEKHFTYDKDLPGNDHYHAMDVKDLTSFTKSLKHIHELLGSSDHKKPLSTEKPARLNARRSIVLANNVVYGQELTKDDLTYKRPGTGISPSFWNEVIGRKVLNTLEADHVLQWHDLSIE